MFIGFFVPCEPHAGVLINPFIKMKIVSSPTPVFCITLALDNDRICITHSRILNVLIKQETSTSAHLNVIMLFKCYNVI